MKEKKGKEMIMSRTGRTMKGEAVGNRDVLHLQQTQEERSLLWTRELFKDSDNMLAKILQEIFQKKSFAFLLNRKHNINIEET